MAIPLVALQGDPVSAGNAFLSGRERGQAMRANDLAMSEAEDVKRKQSYAAVINAIGYVKGGATPQDQQARLNRVKQWAAAHWPDSAQNLNSITIDMLEPIAAALTNPEDAAKVDLLKAQIGHVGAQTYNTYNMAENRDRATTSGINVDNAQIGNYGASTANYRDQIRSRQGQDMATGYGQVPEGYIMGPEGAAPIPGVPLAAKGVPGGVKPPAGYRFTPDGQALEAIPGGPAAAKLAGQDFAAKQALEKVDMTIGKIDQALGQVSRWTAGPGSYLSMIPGTGARDLEATLATVKANLGFNELAAMRAASPTGGALGQITERELTFLQSTLAALDTAQSPEQLRQNLMQVKEHYNRWRAAMAQAENPNAGAGITAGPADPGVDALLQKYGVQ